MRARFRSYSLAADGGPLKIDAYYGNDDRAVQEEYERRTKQVVDGVVSDADLAALGLAKPIIFTVEGHMSNMFAGPCAFTAKALEDEKRAHWQPVGYDTTRMPFNNQSGVDELSRLLGLTILDNGTPFPSGTPWEMIIFSQGGIVGCKTFMQHILPENGKLHWRLKDLKGVVAFGNPYREKGVVAPWIPDPPKADRQGVSDVRMVNTPEYWREVARSGDLYTDNQSEGDRALFKTMIYKIVAEGSFSGGKAGFLARVIDLLQPADDLIPVALAIFDGMRFVTNMQSHGMYDLGPCIDFLRSRL